MRQFTQLLVISIIIGLSSCRSDFETVANSGNLVFSRDTVFLDTVFSNVSSSTYTLKVFNHSKKDISIPIIQLGKGISSKYRMTVDGMQGNQGKVFDNVNILAKDSLYIFIETTANVSDTNSKDFLYTDQILFDIGKNIQKVELVTLIQDAILLYPEKNSNNTSETILLENKKINGFYLNEDDPINGDELNFSNKKPYVIYGYAAVPENKIVTFEAGARVHFHANSGLLVSNKATIHVNGATSKTDKLENEVVFEGDRLEPNFSEIAGQWDAIRLAEGSTNHIIKNLTIKNASIGLLIQNNDGTTVDIKNSQIYNCTNYGILAKNGKIIGENMVINNCGLASLACTLGGNYQFTHCSLYNNWSSSNQNALLISNHSFGEKIETKDLAQATFNNCIIYGSYSNAMDLQKKEGALFEYQFNNCLIKFNQNSTQTKSNSLYLFGTDPIHYNNIILNQDPKFFNFEKNKFNINNTSSAFAKGNSSYLIPLDILGKTRSLPPDLGAYQNEEFKKK